MIRIYTRVSTEEQAESGLSLESQHSRCLAYRQVYYPEEEFAVYEERGVSAKGLDRPELQRLLREIGPGDVLLAVKLDRVTRSIADFPTLCTILDARRADFALIEERIDRRSAMGRLVLHFQLAVLQFEREVTGERTSAALTAKGARGEVVGRPGFGWARGIDGKAIPDDTVDPGCEWTRAEAAEVIAAAVLQGESFRGIGAELSQGKGHPYGPTGHGWSGSGTRRAFVSYERHSRAVNAAQ